MYCPSCDHALVAIDMPWNHGDPRPAATHTCTGCGGIFLEYLVPAYETILLPFADYLHRSHGKTFADWVDDLVSKAFHDHPRSA